MKYIFRLLHFVLMVNDVDAQNLNIDSLYKRLAQ